MYKLQAAPVFLDLQATVDKAIALVDLLVDTPDKAQLFRTGGGYSMIFAPDGSPLCKHLPEHEEGIVYADIDLSLISIAPISCRPCWTLRAS